MDFVEKAQRQFKDYKQASAILKHLQGIKEIIEDNSYLEGAMGLEEVPVLAQEAAEVVHDMHHEIEARFTTHV